MTFITELRLFDATLVFYTHSHKCWFNDCRVRKSVLNTQNPFATNMHNQYFPGNSAPLTQT